MVSKVDLAAGLAAINRVLIRGRFLAGEGAGVDVLFRFLDHAEVLPTLLTPDREEPTADEFREALGSLAEEFPDCRAFVAEFDARRGRAA